MGEVLYRAHNRGRQVAAYAFGQCLDYIRQCEMIAAACGQETRRHG
jgi:hypothetical protein